MRNTRPVLEGILTAIISGGHGLLVDALFRAGRARLGVETQDLVDSNDLKPGTVLIRGRLLCVPYHHKYWLYRNTTLYASFITTNRVVVWGSNFPKKHSFFVNIRTQKGAAFTRVNKIQASKQGDVQTYIRIPKSLMKSRPTVEVCLKDIKTSYRICAFARR